MKIAILGTENSHAYAFANLVKNNAKYKDVEIVGVYGYDENANKKLVDEGLVSYVAKDPHEFVGKVDGIMVTARHGDHHHEYALPYVKAGIPAFIDKPFTVELEKAYELVNAAKESGALLCGGSSLKFVPEYEPLTRFAKANPPVGGYVTAPVNMVNDYANFYFYSQHLVESMFTIFGSDVKSVYASCPDLTKNRISLIFNYGDFDVTGLFYSSYDYTAGVYSKKGCLTAKSESSNAHKWYEAELDEFLTMVANQQMPHSYEALLKPVQLLHAIEESYTQKKEVEVVW